LVLYVRDKSTGGSALITPLLVDVFRPHANVRHQWLLPLFSRRLWDDNEEILLLPVYYHRHLKDDLTGALHDTTVVFPFYMGTTRVTPDGDLTYARHLLFFPLFRREHSPRDDAIAYDVLWPFLHYSRTPASFNVRALPLLWVYEDRAARADDGQFRMARARVHFPLYYAFETAAGRKFTALFPFWCKYEGRDIGTHPPPLQANVSAANC
jgi:hypothetical protein